jgi:EmrB/QacA subfamily drug resistance transporter
MSDARTKRVILFIAAIASFLTPFMGSSINIALPSIGKEFAMNALAMNWVATAYLLAAAMFLVPFGKLADIRGRKKIFSWGIGVYTLASLLSAVAASGFWLIASRILQGLGGAMIFGTAVAILTSVFPAGERGKALGISVASTYTGLSLGPFLGGLLTEQLGWRSIFYVNGFAGLAIIALVLWKMRSDWAEARGEKFDWIGSVSYSLALVALMYGFSRLPAVPGFGLVLVGCAGGWLFCRWELTVESPVLNMKLFRNNTVFALSNLAALINYSATFAVGFLLSLYLQYIKGLSPQRAGLVLIAQPIVMALVSPAAGRISDKVEPRIISSAGMALSAFGLLLFAFLKENTALAFIIASLVMLGFGFALFSSPNTNAVMSSIERKFYGVGSATLATMRLTGQALSMGIAMLIFAIYIGKERITPENFSDFLGSLKTAFILFAALCAGGVFASLARGRVRG